jgi:CRISPR type III-B/RAMP module-associated protein Cmr3
MTTGSETWFSLTPTDTVAIRDGRPFNAGGDHTFTSISPRPSTVAGALHPIVGGAGFTRDLRFTGPLAWDDEEEQPLFPWPLDLVEDDDFLLTRLRPQAVGQGTVDAADLPPSLLVGIGDAKRTSLITGTDLSRYLNGDDITDTEAKKDVWLPELHVGLHKGDDRKAADGMLYAAEHRRLRPKAGLLARVQHHDELNAVEGSASFGGERRVVEVAPANAPLLPVMPQDFPGGKVLVYLASPAIFEDGWRPVVPDGCTLVAAAFDGPEMVSSWGKFDGELGYVARNAVVAGSVYYLQFTNVELARRWARSVHGQCLRQASTKLRSAGFGWCFTGRWS